MLPQKYPKSTEFINFKPYYRDVNNNEMTKKSQQQVDLEEAESFVLDYLLHPKAKTPKVLFQDVVGLDFAKQQLKECVLLPFLNSALFSGLREPPKGVILHGPPGTGKTLLARALAGECKVNLLSISASSILSKWHGESEKILKAVFRVAEKNAPCVVFLDEVDSLLSARGGQSETEGSRRLKTEFLTLMDGFEQREGRVVFLAATNRLNDIDEAALRRFPKKLYIKKPSSKDRNLLVRQMLGQSGKQKVLLSTDNINEIVRASENFSADEIVSLCKEAALESLRKIDFEDLVKMSESKLPPLTMKHFAASFNQNSYK